jgi:hypothetical protein
MHVECIVNSSGASLILVPQNPLEEEIVKNLLKQENNIIEIRGPVSVLNHSVKNGIYIGKQLSHEKHDEKSEGV